MPISNLFQGAPELTQYIPAALNHSKSMGWTIDYYVYNPVSNKLDRRRMRLNKLRERYTSTSAFRRAAADIVFTINQKLAGGWTPFGTSENVRYYTPLPVVVDYYLKEKEKDLRPETMRSYRSFCKIFLEWIAQEVPNCKCLLFNKTLAVRYMDDYYQKRQVEARSYNNQLKMARAFFSWCMEKCYVKENPFEFIKPKKTQQKHRTVIDATTRAQIRRYFEEHEPGFMIVMELIYTSFIRPIEVSRIQVGQIDVMNKCIHFSGEKTKNGHERVAPLSDELLLRIIPLIASVPNDWYLIGKGYRPQPTPLSKKMYGKQWLKMRKALNLPDTMQLYSLRDTGFFDCLKAGIPALTVMQAADHHDLAMTTRYANHVDKNMVDIIRQQAPDF